MSTCTIIIKIKDYFPKIDSIPYQNFICLFTNGENEGQIPLISQDNESFQTQIKNVVSDIKYKIHVLDYNDMSLIGMCEMSISYNIIRQISPPNGFIQEQQKKLLMDLKTKRKLFGTILNTEDIYLNIYSEIYLNERNNMNMLPQNNKTTSRKKNLISINKKKIDGSPRTIHKKKLIMQMNSDRQALINLNKKKYMNVSNSQKQNSYHVNNEKKPNAFKPNSSFNYRDNSSKENKNEIVKLNNNNNKNKIIKNKTKKNVISKKSIEKLFNEKDYNISHNNFINNFKIESNKKGKNNSKKRKTQNINKDTYKSNNNNAKILKGGVNYFNNQNNNNLLMNNINQKISNDNYNQTDDIQFNNNYGNKITTIESLENINFSGKKYITKSKTKKNNHKNNNSNINNALFSTNLIDQEINDLDKIILEKGNEIGNDFNIQIKNKNKYDIYEKNKISNNNIDYIDKAQLEIKNNIIKLMDFYTLLSHKILKINQKNKNINQ